MAKRNEVAAYNHKRMCEDPRFGYTQGDARWGNANNPEWWECQGVNCLFWIGDRDCSSSVIDVWSEALRGTPYEGILLGAWWTGNIEEVFVASGLFERKDPSFLAEPGDLYLVHRDDIQHVSMCQTQYPDVLSEFLCNEWGGITGGQEGDQTGGESVVRAYWEPSGGYSCILHYNGKADDGSTETPSEDPAPSGLTFQGPGAYKCVADALAVKSEPTVDVATVATYYEGEVVYLDDWSQVGGKYLWGRYTSYNGDTRYIAIGRTDGTDTYLEHL